MCCLGILVAATIAYVRTGKQWIIAWGAISIALMVGTIVTEALFRRCDPGRPFCRLARWYVGRLSISGLLSGIGGAAASQGDDALTKLLLFSFVTRFLVARRWLSLRC
jgi:hypothetical protein